MLIGNDLQVYVKTTETCNLNCSHCFTSGSQGKKVFFDPGKTFSFIEKLSELPGTRSLRAVLHGGEPMLAPIKDLEVFCESLKNLEKVTSLGIQTNLSYTLTPERLDFLNRTFLPYGIGTSWDADLRFGNLRENPESASFDLWQKNVRTLSQNGHNLTLMVCLSSFLIKNYEPKEIIEQAIEWGFQNILFERITHDGNAQVNRAVVPDNRSLDKWIERMFEQTREHGLHEKINNMFLSELALAFLSRTHTGNRCRGCEQHLFTINADGSVAGCPNSAPTSAFGHIDNHIHDLVSSPARIGAICKEKTRNVSCGQCAVRDICNGDCYKLPWDGEICPAPKSVMLKMRAECETEFYTALMEGPK